MQRFKESQMGGIKQARQALQRMERRKGMHQANQHHRDVFSQMVTSEQATRGTDATIQAQAHGEHQAWQNLNLGRQTWT